MVGAGTLDGLAALLSDHCPASRFAVVADAAVAQLYGARVRNAAAELAPTDLLTFPAGEWNKSRESWAELTDQLLRRRFDRDGAILTLGGGVALDLGGFVAATYQRGIRHVHLPTTLLAMVDGAIGGITGVDSPVGRDAIGSFHQPRLVVADVATIETLPPVHVAAGMAPATRHGLVADGEHLGWLTEHATEIRARDHEVLEHAVHRSLEIARDERIRRERHEALPTEPGFGDPIAHALRTLLGYELLHGESVALGMLAEAAIGNRIGVTAPEVVERIREALVLFRLPDTPPSPVDASNVLDVLLPLDVATTRCVRLALPERVGTMAHDERGSATIPVEATVIAEAIRGLGWP